MDNASPLQPLCGQAQSIAPELVQAPMLFLDRLKVRLVSAVLKRQIGSDHA